ncbi:hypothetical protein BMR08_16605, partial [Methylococcaceae bacterium CS2]
IVDSNAVIHERDDGLQKNLSKLKSQCLEDNVSLYNDLCNLRIELKPYYGLTPVNTIADSTRKSSQKNLNLKHSNVRLVSRNTFAKMRIHSFL